MALGFVFTASGCSLVGTSTGVATELLGTELGPIVERVVGDDPMGEDPVGGEPVGEDPVAADDRTAGLATVPGTEPNAPHPASQAGDELPGSEAAQPAGAEPADVEPGEAERGEAQRGVGTIRLRPRPRPGAFSMNLYRDGDFLSQQTTFWCIPASAQTMMNIIDEGRPNRSKRFQRRLYRIGDRLDEYGRIERDDEPDQWRGMGITEWVGLLNRFGYGPYELGRAGTRHNALRKAAKAIRRTGKPVGLVVWRGAHAWVMSGFVATADPAYTDEFRVTAVYVQDPWYPRTSSIWGRSRPPDSLLSIGALGGDYLPYGRPHRRDWWRDGRYILVLPQLEPGTRVA